MSANPTLLLPATACLRVPVILCSVCTAFRRSPAAASAMPAAAPDDKVTPSMSAMRFSALVIMFAVAGLKVMVWVPRDVRTDKMSCQHKSKDGCGVYILKHTPDEKVCECSSAL